jgi:peroxiredoxin Q/BCP
LVIEKYFVTLPNKFYNKMNVGDKIPDVLGTDQDGKEVRASDYKGRKIALYFYPKDNTSGCTAEACSLRDGYGELQRAGYEVIGVSKDSAKSHQGFIAKHALPFRLIADTDTKLQQLFGVWAEKSLYGRKYMGTLRQTFLIDENGVVERILTKVDTAKSAAQILGR